MKLLNKMPLRLRLTILTALVLTVICMLLTITSVFNAQKIYSVPAEDYNSNTSPSNPSMNRPPVTEDETNNDFTYASIVYMFIMIVLGTCASYFIAGKALKPVADLSKSIENIDESKLFQRLEGFNTNDEVARLAKSFNHMILKLEKSFNHQKQFAANAAHELRTPLAGIIANIEVLQLDENPTVQEYKEVLEDTLANAQRLSTLVHDLLKMNTAFNADHFVNIDVKEMFDVIILALSESSKDKNIRVENNISGIMLSGEKSLLQRAFFNLVQNAMKYNKRNGEVVITAAQNDDVVTVTIEDTGIGIPEDELEHIFEPFYRVDTSRSRELGGSGLGLSIVKTIIEKHNGNILIESEVGNFSKVTVMLPKN
ncbi:sensor histidine kinase [Paenibacillus alkalitolerans]|uniref:sensor histidine kinase n=1 Tax=Paenibacillus alkalitolerans TaxID=2799335 RepID=UPI0018F593BB|nr:HAMP domain-containing sensor histidine kinase [Paenibacillus alkalitolerans]